MSACFASTNGIPFGGRSSFFPGCNALFFGRHVVCAIGVHCIAVARLVFIGHGQCKGREARAWAREQVVARHMVAQELGHRIRTVNLVNGMVVSEAPLFMQRLHEVERPDEVVARGADPDADGMIQMRLLIQFVFDWRLRNKDVHGSAQHLHRLQENLGNMLVHVCFSSFGRDQRENEQIHCIIGQYSVEKMMR